MGLGKSQKQRKNIDAKIAKREAVQKKNDEVIRNLIDDRTYQIVHDEDCHLNGLFMTGKQIKEMHNLK